RCFGEDQPRAAQASALSERRACLLGAGRQTVTQRLLGVVVARRGEREEVVDRDADDAAARQLEFAACRLPAEPQPGQELLAEEAVRLGAAQTWFDGRFHASTSASAAAAWRAPGCWRRGQRTGSTASSSPCSSRSMPQRRASVSGSPRSSGSENVSKNSLPNCSRTDFDVANSSTVLRSWNSTPSTSFILRTTP